jgi:class 3 adenylate cyclase
VVGLVTNFASRLSRYAAAAEILVGPHAFGAVAEGVETAPLGEVESEGFGRPVNAREVLRLR